MIIGYDDNGPRLYIILYKILLGMDEMHGTSNVTVTVLFLMTCFIL